MKVIINPYARQPVVSQPAGSTGLNAQGKPFIRSSQVRVKPILNPLARQTVKK
jgi:hypothetical protein